MDLHHYLAGLFPARSQILERWLYLTLSELCRHFVRACTAVLGNTFPASVTAIVCICATCLFIILSQITVD